MPIVSEKYNRCNIFTSEVNSFLIQKLHRKNFCRACRDLKRHYKKQI